MTRKLEPIELNHLIKCGRLDLLNYSADDTPVEYLTGLSFFHGLSLTVNPSVLIPRIETEKLVDLVIADLKTNSIDTPSIIDIGTGSGALGVTISSLLESDHITHQLILSDISPVALEVARQNALKYLSNQPKLVESDLLSNITDNYDVVVANLPYIPSSRIQSLDTSVKDFEPRLALIGGQTGTEIINRLLSQIFIKNTPQAIYLEIDSAHTISEFLTSSFYSSEIINDQFERPRFLIYKKLAS